MIARITIARVNAMIHSRMRSYVINMYILYYNMIIIKTFCRVTFA